MTNSALELELHVLSLHGEPVRGARVALAGGGVRGVADEEHPGRYRFELPEPADYQLRIERFQEAGGFDHRTLRATLFYVRGADGQVQLRALTPPEGQRSRVRSLHIDEGRARVVVALDYLWFTHIGTPPTLGNNVQLLSGGELGWSAVARAIREAERSIHLTTWIYQPTTELVRTAPLSDPDEREANTIQGLLEASAAEAVKVRLLVWDAPFIGIAGEARARARAAGDDFEVLQQANPTERPLLNDDEWPLYNKALGNFQIGSYHQKTCVVDGRVGFCGGMNLKENDWDTLRHRLFDPRRCRFSRRRTWRERVSEARVPADHPPRHDYVARLEGPAVKHLEDNFRQRWNHLIDEGARWAENATLMDESPMRPPQDHGSAIQVVRTMPEPFSERGILDVHIRAIRTARRLIYIEDQYFRSTHVSDAIADAARKWPGLQVIVVTLQSQADDQFAGGWSRECYERIKRRLPDFELHTLKVTGMDADDELQLAEIDNHAKLMIVDDIFLTVGSCNINDRGFEYEGEINIAMVDSEQVQRMRLDIWRAHLGGDERLSGHIEEDAEVWREHAEENRRFERTRLGEPRSLVYPYEPKDRDTFLNRDVF